MENGKIYVRNINKLKKHCYVGTKRHEELRIENISLIGLPTVYDLIT